MARLFSKDYHEHSTSWFFNHAVIALDKGDLLHWKYRDGEDKIHLRFYASEARKEQFAASLDLIYDPIEQKILSHKCPECPEEEACRHYLSVLRYAYFYMKTEIFEAPIVETCNLEALRAPESLWEQLQASVIELEGIYNPAVDKIRFYYGSYGDLKIPALIRISLGEHPEGMTASQIEEYSRVIQAFGDDELRTWQFVHLRKAAHSSKGKFYSIYKADFAGALTLLEKLGARTLVKETGEALSFVAHPYQLSLRIEPMGKQHHKLSAIIVDELSAWYAGYPSWLFFRNKVYRAYLPLRNEIIDQVLGDGLILNERDLVYYRTLVYHELRKQDIYLDFDDRIELPVIIDEEPRVALELSKTGAAYLLKGHLSYSGDRRIPLSVVRFRAPLVSFPIEGEDDTKYWFRVPVETVKRVEELYRKLPGADLNRLEQYSELVFEDQQSIDRLKATVFELSETDWDIVIADDIERDFVYKAHLEVELSASRSEDIDWFNYELRYRYKDLAFTHDELSRYFKSGDDYLETKDGRMIFVSNPQVFYDMERLIKRSEKDKDLVYRARLMNLPYYQRMMQDNPQLRLVGDSFLKQMFEELLSRKLTREESLPVYLQTVLRGYQKAGFSWLKMLSRYRLNGILADEMGLGKTVQALSILGSLPEDKVSLVICPKTLLYNWAAEIEKFHTNIRYLVVEGPPEERRSLLATPNVQLFIMSYSLVLNEIETLKAMQFHWVVLDEAQNIKNVSAQRTGAIKKLRSDHRLALSGTPIENDLTELWSIFDFLMPGYLGTLASFKKEYIHSDNAETNRLHLHKAVSPFILRRIKKEVLLELPDKQEQVSWCKLSPLQEKLYLQILDNVKQKLFPGEEQSETNYIHILAALTKLRQVCNHPHLANQDILPDPGISSKLEMLMELVQDSIQSGHKVLVFSQFVQMLKIIRTEFDKLNIEYAYLDGQTKDRMGQVNRFNQDPSLKLFLISLKAGGTGLNLSSADTVILYDPWWNPMVEQQAIDRSHRMGQVNKVNVFRLISLGTVEEKIVKLQQSKRELFNSVIEEGQQLIKTMSTDEIRSLFEY